MSHCDMKEMKVRVWVTGKEASRQPLQYSPPTQWREGFSKCQPVEGNGFSYLPEHLFQSAPERTLNTRAGPRAFHSHLRALFRNIYNLKPIPVLLVQTLWQGFGNYNF